MTDEIKPFVRGDRIRSITTIERFKGIMNDLVRGYPAYLYFGIFEYYFGNNAQKIIEFLEEDGVIKIIPATKNEPIKYRITSNGILLATAMAQLEYSEKMRKLTIVLVVIGGSALLLGLNHFLLNLFQLP